MARESIFERALVVRSYDFGEADRIVVLLTRGRGLIRGVAKGVRRGKSRFGSRLEPFVEIDVTLYPGRNLASIAKVETINFFASGIIDDFERYACASAVMEVVEKLSTATEEEALYDLTVDALSRLRIDPQPQIVMDTYFLQALELAGWAPSFFACAQCGQAGPHHAYHAAAGGAVCVHCRPPGAVEVDPEVLHLAWLWQHGGDSSAIATPQRVAMAHKLVRSFVQWQLEKKLASLNVLNQATRSGRMASF